jgi:hypothetical protein
VATGAFALPPGFVNLRTVVPAGDTSPEAQFYGQLDKVADYLAGHVLGMAQDTTDRNGAEHVHAGDLSSGNQAWVAVSSAISLYMLNMPYSAVKGPGWKAALSSILALPICTWDATLSFSSAGTGSNNQSCPSPIQKRATGKWSVHPAYFAFFFWNDALSFSRFLQWDSTYGFTFGDVFANVFQICFFDCYESPQQDETIGTVFHDEWNALITAPVLPADVAAAMVPTPASGWMPAQPAPTLQQLASGIANSNLSLGQKEIAEAAGAYLDAQAAFNPAQVDDGQWSADPGSDWIRHVENYPAQFTGSLQAIGNAYYSGLAHATIMADVAVVAAFASIVTAGAAIAATGLTVASGASMLSSVMSLAGYQPTGLVSDILVLGKAFNPSQLCDTMGLDMSSDASLVPVTPPLVVTPTLASVAPLVTPGVPAMSLSDITDLSGSATDAASSIDLSSLDLASVGDPAVDTSGLTGVTGSAASVDTSQLESSIFINPPTVPIVDPTTGADYGDITGTADSSVNICPAPASSVTGADLATTGTDSTAIDQAQANAVSAASTSTGGFSLGSYVGVLAKIAATVTTAIKTGAAPAGTSNKPTAGTTQALPSGETSKVNPDGSTTIYSATGVPLQTIMPSGKVVAGGATGASNTMLYAFLGLGGVAALLLSGIL